MGPETILELILDISFSILLVETKPNHEVEIDSTDVIDALHRFTHFCWRGTYLHKLHNRYQLY